MRLSDAGLRCREAKLIYPDHRSPPWLTEDATRDRSNRLLDGGADGKFAPSKIAPGKRSKEYPRRRRGQRTINNGCTENRTQNVSPAVGTTRNTDVHEGIRDNGQ